MALNESLVNAQIKALQRQKSSLQQLTTALTGYRGTLNRAWSGGEMTYINKTIDDLTAKSKSLATKIDDLRQWVDKAMEEILEEETRKERERRDGTD